MSLGSVAADVAAEDVAAGVSVGALADLYARLAPSIRRLCLGYVRDPDDADDLTQDAFMRLASRLDALEGDPAAYAFRIARNLCCDELARRKRRDHLAQQATDASRDETDAVVARSESRDLLDRVRQGLSPEEFALFVQIASGHSQAEVAEKLGITETNVSVRLCRARKKVRVLFGAASAVASWTFWRRVVGSVRSASGRSPVVAFPAAVLSAAVIGALTFGSLALQPWSTRPARAAQPPGLAMRPDTAVGARVSVPASPSASVAVDHGATAPAPLSPSSLTQSLIDPGGGATPQQTGFSSIAVSPDYTSDHTVLASGTLAVGCGNPVACDVLFRSSDGGRTWSHLPGRGFAGGALLLPPAYATDHVVYAMGALGLQVSRDGGASFTLAVPGQVAAAVAPSSTPASTDIVLGTSPLTVYHSATGLVTPGPQLPLGTAPPDALAYQGATGTLFATADVENAAGGQDGEVIRCAADSGCAVAAVAAHATNLQLTTSPSGDEGVAAAYAQNVLLMSWDDGRTFTVTSLPPSSVWRTAVVTSDGSLVAISQTSDSTEVPRAFSATGASLPLTSATTEGVASGAQFMTSTALPDGRFLGGLQPDQAGHLFGLICSVNGRVWAASC